MGKKPLPIPELPTDEPEIALAEQAPASAVGEVIVSLHIDTSPIIDYASRHFDCQLDRKQANTLRQLQKAMDVRGERLNNGKRVVTKIDTLRRVLEVIAEAKP